MAAVLPFDPDFRRRTPPAARRAVPSTRPARATPLPRRAMRAVGSAMDGAMESAIERAVGPLTIRPVPAAVAAPVDEAALARWFFPLALLVALLDLAVKAFAEAGLAGLGSVPLVGPLALHLVHNPASAGGVSLGEHTRALNLTATGVVIGFLVMLVPTLAAIDRRSTTAVALIAGGGLGNLLSMLLSPRGVPDFLAVGHWVVNVADLAMLVGLAMLGGTAWTIVRAIRVHGARQPVRAGAARR